jgi:hypothetical protein
MVLKFNTADESSDTDRDDLFEVDGVMYSIPREVPPNEGVKYLTDLRAGAHDIALSRLLDRLIGKEGVNALTNCKAMTKDDLKQLLGAVSAKVGGLLEEVSTGN